MSDLQKNIDKLGGYLARFKQTGILNQIDGDACAAHSGETFETRSPVDESLICSVTRGSAADIDAAAMAAKAAFPAWRDVPAGERNKILHRIADKIVERAEEIALCECWDTGQALRFMSKAALRGAENFRFFADKATAARDGQSLPSPTLMNVTTRVPIGPVGVITPWNTPFMLSTWKIAPALAAGCTVVHKPAEFSPLTARILMEIAEEAGLISEIGAWVAREVARLQTRIDELGYAVPLTLALNVSPRQLSDTGFLGFMKSLPEQTGCAPDRISLEITESVILGDIPNARETLATLKECGYQIVIDDFGTGYSNLAYLHNYPIDGIKIDRVFMEDIDAGGEIVKLILSLATALGADVVAEGGETVEQRSWLSQNGCDRYQGYLYSRPVPIDRFLSMLETQRRLAAM